MTDENQIAPNYRGLADGMGERTEPTNAVSATQYELMKLAPGERWSHRATQRDYRVGGNQGEFAAPGAAETAAGGGTPAMTTGKPDGTPYGEQQDITLAQAGGPEEVVDNRNLPQRIQQGITTKYEITDRNLDFDDEFGYPSPT